MSTSGPPPPDVLTPGSFFGAAPGEIREPGGQEVWGRRCILEADTGAFTPLLWPSHSGRFNYVYEACTGADSTQTNGAIRQHRR